MVMFSQDHVQIVYGSTRICKSLAPANKRKTHRTIVVAPRRGFLRIPPDGQDVNHVKIVPTTTSSSLAPPRDDERRPTPPLRPPLTVYPYGTSLIRRSARDAKLRSKLIVFHITRPALGQHPQNPGISGPAAMDHSEFLTSFRREVDRQTVLTAESAPATVEVCLGDALPGGVMGGGGLPAGVGSTSAAVAAAAAAVAGVPVAANPVIPATATVTTPPMIDLTSHHRPLTLFTPASAAAAPAVATNGGNATYILPADCRYAPLFASKYKYVFEEVSRLMRLHDSTAVQLQISASCGNAFQALKSALLKLHNVTVLAGQQLITQTMPHTPQAVATFKFFHQDPNRVLDCIRPVVPRSTSYHETGVYQMWVSGATKKDLFDAVTLCASIVEKQPDVFNINVSLLTYPSIAAPHLPLYNEFTSFRLPTS